MFGQHGFANRGANSMQSFSNSPFSSIANSSTNQSSPFGTTGSASSNFGSFGNQSSPFAAANLNQTGTGFGQHGFGQQNATSNIFVQGGQTTSNAFSSFKSTQSFQPSSTFGSNSVNQNLFANNSTAGFKGFNTATQNSASPFSNANTGGGQLATAQTTNVQSTFGSNSAFGNANAKQTVINSSPFGQMAAKASNTPLFGSNNSNANKPSMSPFGSMGSVSKPQFGTNTTPSSFGNSTATNTGSGFGFGTQSTSNESPFGSQNGPGTNTFQNNHTGSDDNGRQQVSPGQSGNAANTTIQPNNLGNGMAKYKQAPVDEKPTETKDLSSNIIEYFKADHFDLGKVPDIPPPLEMC
ncbi:hypothetical protein HII13_003274 [Brettanomyces bruxellensis]|nr:hypothetical protein HII13_003274 [Brettanomyces bruxellensis]